MGGGNPLKKLEEEAGALGDVILPGSSLNRRALVGARDNPGVAADILIPGFSLQGRAATGSLDEAFGGGLGNAKGAPQSNPGADELARLSRALFEETDPLRRGLIGRSEQFLGGGLDVTQSPQYGALKKGAEDQFKRARDEILASTPTGGGLTSALTQAELAKAGVLTQGIGELGSRELDRAFALATGTPLQASVSGLGTAGNIQAQLAQSQAAQNAAGKQALGTGAGAALGSKGPSLAGAGGTAAALGGAG